MSGFSERQDAERLREMIQMDVSTDRSHKQVDLLGSHDRYRKTDMSLITGSLLFHTVSALEAGIGKSCMSRELISSSIRAVNLPLPG